VSQSVVIMVYNSGMVETHTREAGMTQDLKAWLAAMPPESEIEARISEVEDELELLQALKQVRAHARSQNGSRPTEAKDIDLDTLRKRLSTERIAILRVILARGEAGASIQQVVQATEGDRTNIASNLQRMVPAELLERAGRGLYAVTPEGQALIRELDGEPT
jgi:hypothetical protein